MSTKRVETFNLGLWRIFTTYIRTRHASEELSAGSEPHWLGWSIPLDLVMAESLTVITRSRIFKMVLRRMIMKNEAGES